MTPRRQPVAPLRADFTVRFHSEAQIEPLREATLALLERTGVKYHSAKALAVLKKAGAKVDEGSDLVRLPRRLVEEALALAPRSFVLASRDGADDLDLAAGFTYGTTDGCGVEVVDWRNGERRSSTKADLADITRMQDFLGSISFWWPTVSAGDCGETAQLHEIETGWNNTTKHLMGMVQGEKLARHAVEMATVLAGGAAELRRRPVLSDLIGTVSPLVNDKDGIEAGLVFAAAGIPVCYVTMPNLGTTAPATKAGAFVVGAAEIVSAAVLHELAAPGAPVWGSIMQIYADPRTALTMTTPLDDRCRFLGTELLHSFGLPALGAFGGTDAETPRHLAGGRRDHAAAAPGAAGRLRDLHRHRADQHLQPVHPREAHARRRSLPPRAARVPRHPHGRGVAGPRRDRRSGPGRSLPRAAAHAPPHARTRSCAR